MASPSALPLILFGMTSGVSAQGFIQGQAPFFRNRGWRTALMCSDEAGVREFAREQGLHFVPVALERNPSPAHDLRSAMAVLAHLRRLRPNIAVWGSPKASLLGVVACRLLRIPSIYVIHGLRLEAASGWRRGLLWATEAMTCRIASKVVADGEELRELVVRLRLLPQSRVVVLAHGSANGVAPNTSAPRYRAELGLEPDDLVVTFAGRITRDKGIAEILIAWPAIAARHPRAHLVVAGRPDAADPHGEELAARLSAMERAYLLGHVADLARLWRDTDLLLLPSYREGLPLVVIEAAAAGVPAVVTDCTGCTEAVVNGVTGVVVPRFDAHAIGEAVSTLLANHGLRKEMGAAASRRALERYDRERLWAALADLVAGVATRPLFRSR